MAITRSSQIFDVSTVYKSTEFIEKTILYLRNAKSSLLDAKNYCSYDVFHTDQGNSFPEKIDAQRKKIDDTISKCETLKQAILDKANKLHHEDYLEYQAYLLALSSKNNVKERITVS